MGKWAVYSQGKDEDIRYHIHKHGDPAGLLTMRGDFDEATAQRYKTALNIADAGVDLREFPMRLLHFRGYRHRSESPNATSSETMHQFFEALTYFESIANAVEGTTKEEGV